MNLPKNQREFTLVIARFGRITEVQDVPRNQCRARVRALRADPNTECVTITTNAYAFVLGWARSNPGENMERVR